MILWPATLPLSVVMFFILKRFGILPQPSCVLLYLCSVQNFSHALCAHKFGVFSSTLTFFMRTGCALFRNGPVREVARYPLFFCCAPLPGLDSNKLKSNPRSAAQHDTLIANPIAFPIHNLIILY